MAAAASDHRDPATSNTIPLSNSRRNVEPIMMGTLMSAGVRAVRHALGSTRATLSVLAAAWCSLGVAQAAVAGNEAFYASLHPYYIEYCAVSQD